MERVEASLRQCIRLQTAESSGAAVAAEAGLAANIAVSFVQGRWLQFAKGGFRKRPSDLADQASLALFP
jgi:TetR/AcrR family transcriptional regulator